MSKKRFLDIIKRGFYSGQSHKRRDSDARRSHQVRFLDSIKRGSYSGQSHKRRDSDARRTHQVYENTLGFAIDAAIFSFQTRRRRRKGLSGDRSHYLYNAFNNSYFMFMFICENKTVMAWANAASFVRSFP